MRNLRIKHKCFCLFSSGGVWVISSAQETERLLASHYERVQVGISYIDFYIKHIYYLEPLECSQYKTEWLPV